MKAADSPPLALLLVALSAATPCFRTLVEVRY